MLFSRRECNLRYTGTGQRSSIKRPARGQGRLQYVFIEGRSPPLTPWENGNRFVDGESYCDCVSESNEWMVKHPCTGWHTVSSFQHLEKPPMQLQSPIRHALTWISQERQETIGAGQSFFSSNGPLACV